MRKRRREKAEERGRREERRSKRESVSVYVCVCVRETYALVNGPNAINFEQPWLG